MDDLITHATRQAQASALAEKVNAMFPTAEEEREAEVGLIREQTAARLAELHKAIKTQTDAAVACIQEMWDFTDEIADGGGDADASTIKRRTTELRTKYEQLQSAVGELVAEYNRTRERGNAPAAARDDMLRRFPMLDKGGAFVPEPGTSLEETPATEPPLLPPSGQPTRRRRMDPNTPSVDWLVAKYPALKR